MANKDSFDDDGFLENFMQKQREVVPMPESMSRLLKIIIGAGVVILVSIIAWVVWPSADNPQAGNVPIVRADTEPYKVEPEDRGGMPIPNRDSSIFETIEKTEPRKVENLLEDPEQPVKKEEIFTEEKQETVVTEPVAKMPVSVPESELRDEVVATSSDDKSVKKVEEAAEPAVATQTEQPKPKAVDVIATLKKDAGTEKPKAETKKSTPAVKSGSTYIQLASVKSDSDAKQKWLKLQSQYSALKTLSLRVSKADLGAKGVFYRVQAGPMSPTEASATCSKVKSAGGDCLIVK